MTWLHGGNTNLRNGWALWMFVTSHLRLQFSLTRANPAVCGAALSAGSGKQSKLKITQRVAADGKSLSNLMSSAVTSQWEQLAIAGSRESPASEIPVCYKKYEFFSQLKELCGWGCRNPLLVFLRDEKANLTVHRCQHKTSSYKLKFNRPSHDGFAKKIMAVATIQLM